MSERWQEIVVQTSKRDRDRFVLVGAGPFVCEPPQQVARLDENGWLPTWVFEIGYTHWRDLPHGPQ